MCIRDRKRTTLQDALSRAGYSSAMMSLYNDKGYASQQFQRAHRHDLWQGDIKSVSYTHLDVYKRQECTRRNLISTAPAVVRIPLPAFVCTTAVSYTHLDVYKRQGYGHDAQRIRLQRQNSGHQKPYGMSFLPSWTFVQIFGIPAALSLIHI